MAERGKRKRGPETREALIAAAIAVIERDGIAAATTRSIAEEAGLPLGTVHYWFAGKAELLEAVTNRLVLDVRQRGSVTGDGLTERLTQTYERLADIPLGRQLAVFELTTHTIREGDLRELAREQYVAYLEGSRAELAPWANSIEERLPGGVPALATLIVAVLDGLTLGGIAAPDEFDAPAAIALFASLLESSGIARAEG